MVGQRKLFKCSAKTSTGRHLNTAAQRNMRTLALTVSYIYTVKETGSGETDRGNPLKSSLWFVRRKRLGHRCFSPLSPRRTQRFLFGRTSSVILVRTCKRTKGHSFTHLFRTCRLLRFTTHKNTLSISTAQNQMYRRFSFCWTGCVKVSLHQNK